MCIRDRFRRLKYRALFMTCYGAGLRINEACHLRVADIDSKQMLVHVRHAKGGEERITLLSVKLLEVLRAYWREERPRLWLFPGATPDQPLSCDAAREALQQASLDAGLTKKCTPHTLRHCFATHLLDAGADLVVIQAPVSYTHLDVYKRQLQGDVRGVVTGMRRMASQRDLKGKDRKEMNTVCNYLENNAERMRYDEYLRAGYPIASGVIEGACRHVIKDRMEQGGMRWTLRGAQAMLNVRSLCASSEWKTFHQWRQAEGAKRLHKHRALVANYQGFTA